MKKFIIVFWCGYFLSSCAPAKITPFTPPTIELYDTQQYSVQETLDALPKPESPKKIWVKQAEDGKSFVVVPRAEATHALFTNSEYAKVGVLVKRAVALKEITLEQENLVNSYIDQLNHVKNLFTLEQEKALSYRQMWIDSENAFRQEQSQHKWDNRVNRTAMYLITIGSIVVLALAL